MLRLYAMPRGMVVLADRSLRPVWSANAISRVRLEMLAVYRSVIRCSALKWIPTELRPGAYWPDTLLAAPSDSALRRDVELTKAMGFNGVRKRCTPNAICTRSSIRPTVRATA